jgi:hypothetical protein
VAFHQELGMRWLTEFYSERAGILAHYRVEAPLPAAAVGLGWEALRAEHPPVPQRGRLSLFERAERVGGRDASGWVLLRILRDDGQPAAAAPAQAT